MPWPQFNLSLCRDSRGGPGGNRAVGFLRLCMAIVTVFVPCLGQTVEAPKSDTSTAAHSRPTPLPKQADSLAEAKSEMDSGSLETAERAVRSHLIAHAESSDAHFLLGLILFRRGEAKESLS